MFNHNSTSYSAGDELDELYDWGQVHVLLWRITTILRPPLCPVALGTGQQHSVSSFQVAGA